MTLQVRRLVINPRQCRFFFLFKCSLARSHVYFRLYIIIFVTCEFHMLIDNPETPTHVGPLILSYGIPVRYTTFSPADIVRTSLGCSNGVGNHITPFPSDLQPEPPEGCVPSEDNQFRALTSADIRWVNRPTKLGEHMNGITPMSHHPNSTQAGSQLASPPIHCIPARFFTNSFIAVEGPMKGLRGVSSLPFQDSKST